MTASQRPLGDHALVLGAGMAGLLAARVLADSFDRVTIVERDEIPATPGPRRGVPQALHAHALLGRGQQEIERLFPGLSAELTRAGAVTATPGLDQRFVLGGHELVRVAAGEPALQVTRPCVEHHLRNRVLALGNVTLLPGRDIVGLVASADRQRCAGARVVPRSPGSAAETVAATLVVDAMGRGSRLCRWLAEEWQCAVPVDELNVRVRYATRAYRLAALPGNDRMVLVGPAPGSPRGMAVLAVENGLHLVTLAGIGVHQPATDESDFVDFVREVAPPDVAAAILAGSAQTQVATFRYPSVVRRRFEHARRLPTGVIAVGDALCSFNPIYAQGMTVAALEADTLARTLAVSEHVETLPMRFFRAAARTLHPPWTMALNADLAIPEIEGRRRLSHRLTAALTRRVHATAAQDPVVARQFLRVAGLLDPPGALTRPTILRRLATPLGRPHAPQR